MKKKLLCTAVLAIILTAAFVGVTMASGGTQNDPVLSLSYVNNTVKPQLQQQIEQKVHQKIGDASAVDQKGEESLARVSQEAVLDVAADRVLEQLQKQKKFLYSTNGRSVLNLSKGDTISGLTGTTLLMRNGTAAVTGRPIINISGGTEAKANTAVLQNTNYMIPADDGSGMRITSASATVTVDGAYRVISDAYHAEYFDLADALKRMNLFRGSNIGYELDRGATRTESVVMLLRLLGEENSAMNSTAKHPFDDVDSWAAGYLGYAYQKGYARGVSNTHFGAKDLTSANHYMTFLLRALGYSDQKGDFRWDQALDKAVSLRIITAGEKAEIEKTGFQRDQMVYLSYYTLFAKRKGGEQTLLSHLIESGTVKKADADAAISSITRPRL